MMDLIFSALLGFLTFLHYVTRPIFVYMAKGKKKSLPPIKNDILKISAEFLALKIRKKELSSEEICQAYIQRITEVNPILNAVVENRFQQALKDAKSVDNYLTKSSLNEEDLEKIKPLLGVPITIKESCSLKGLSCTGGMLSRAGYKAETDGEVVARLKSSGAIPLLVSNTPELCCSFECNNLVTGCTNNPYDNTCTSGGSSGGEGALLGAGASVIGLGSDIAGSIRLPAAYNGVFGHKPTARVVSVKGHFPYCFDEKFKDCLVLGPMTRYAKDLRLMLKILVGDKQATQLKLNQKVDLSKINVFHMENSGSVLESDVQSEIKVAINKAVQHLTTSCGATIRDHKFKEFKYIIHVCAKDVYSIKDIPNPLKGENASLVTETIKCIFGYSKHSASLMYSIFLQKLFATFVSNHTAEVFALKKQLMEHLGENGILIYPAGTSTACKHNESFVAAQTVAYLVLANSLGFPATSIPCGLDENGLPIGIQVIAAPNQDRLCLAVAEELERYFGGWIPPK